ncbi:MAG: hypothetical protein GY935_19895 [Gammaproteobacteria bacterium]|nr:hypothetical protein [Gammaproteobacteria bacterium]
MEAMPAQRWATYPARIIGDRGEVESVAADFGDGLAIDRVIQNLPPTRLSGTIRRRHSLQVS